MLPPLPKSAFTSAKLPCSISFSRLSSTSSVPVLVRLTPTRVARFRAPPPGRPARSVRRTFVSCDTVDRNVPLKASGAPGAVCAFTNDWISL